MPDVYKEHLAIRYKEGLLYRSAGWPFAKIAVYRDRIVLSSLFASNELLKKDIVSMKKGKFNVIWDVVYITSKKDGRVFMVQSFNFENLVEKLREFGYKVDTKAV